MKNSSSVAKLKQNTQSSSIQTSMRKKTSLGFNLIELMIIVVIGSILTTIAAPSFIGVLRNAELRDATFSFYSGFLFARSEAIKQGTTVLISCINGTCSTNSDWNFSFYVSSGGSILKTENGSANTARWPHMQIKCSYMDSANASINATEIHFDRNGRAVDNVGAVVTPKCLFTLTNSDGTLTYRNITISALGRPRINQGS